MKTVTESDLKRSRAMYIIEAALEYLISLLVTGAFLATITKELGISDSLTAVLTAIAALGCLFQLASVSFRKNSVKRMVVILSVANQLLFGLLYLIPLFDISKTVKTVIFVCFVVFAYMVYNFAHPKKIAWLMSLVDDDKRGRFTANKEIVSLISGMVFSYLMGLLIDFFKAKNDLKTAFIISAIGGLLLGKLMCKLSKGKINPMIGAAGVSAVPMAARVVHKIGQEEDPSNFLLMHAMGPNVAGVIGSATAAGILMTIFL